MMNISQASNCIVQKRQLTRRTTTLPLLTSIKVVAQWFLVRVGKLSLNDGNFS
jgi:hypothetical protein